MCVAATVLGIISLAIAGGTAGYQVSENEAAKSEARDQARKQKAAAAERLKIAEGKQFQQKEAKATATAKAKADADAAAKRAAEVRSRRSLPGVSRTGSTVLTSPLGVTNGKPGARKTLLGQ